MARKDTLELLGRKAMRQLDDLVIAGGREASLHETGRIRELQAVARHIEMGTYGLCIDCEIDIPLKRLRARPEALRCIDCQKALEARQLRAVALR